MSDGSNLASTNVCIISWKCCIETVKLCQLIEYQDDKATQHYDVLKEFKSFSELHQVVHMYKCTYRYCIYMYVRTCMHTCCICVHSCCVCSFDSLYSLVEAEEEAGGGVGSSVWGN